MVVVTGFHDIVRRTGPRNVIVTACGPVVGDFLAATLNNCCSFCVSLHLRFASLREFYFIFSFFFLFLFFTLGRELSCYGIAPFASRSNGFDVIKIKISIMPLDKGITTTLRHPYANNIRSSNFLIRLFFKQIFAKIGQGRKI